MRLQHAVAVDHVRRPAVRVAWVAQHAAGETLPLHRGLAVQGNVALAAAHHARAPDVVDPKAHLLRLVPCLPPGLALHPCALRLCHPPRLGNRLPRHLADAADNLLLSLAQDGCHGQLVLQASSRRRVISQALVGYAGEWALLLLDQHIDLPRVEHGEGRLHAMLLGFLCHGFRGFLPVCPVDVHHALSDQLLRLHPGAVQPVHDAVDHLVLPLQGRDVPGTPPVHLPRLHIVGWRRRFAADHIVHLAQEGLFILQCLAQRSGVDFRHTGHHGPLDGITLARGVHHWSPSSSKVSMSGIPATSSSARRCMIFGMSSCAMYGFSFSAVSSSM